MVRKHGKTTQCWPKTEMPMATERVGPTTVQGMYNWAEVFVDVLNKKFGARKVQDAFGSCPWEMLGVPFWRCLGFKVPGVMSSNTTL